MPIILRKPVTPGQRGMSVNRQALTRKRPERALTQRLTKHAGRDRFGHISIRHRGGGNKRLYRLMSSLERGTDSTATILSLEYDPNRSATIALILYPDGSKAYILAGAEMTVGQVLTAGPAAEVKPGNRLPLGTIPRGHAIFDIALDPNRTGQMVRSAGSSAEITAHEDDGRYAQVKLPSGEIRRILSTAYATIGTVSNPEHSAVTIGKAGRRRHMGWRPEVRGKAMNPNDHPHGGGEGSNSIGLKYPKTPWGKHALGTKTRRSKRTNVFILKSRHEGRRSS
ncbi:50S ribosomal protein L2 [Candidatus Berkelbacteria bacterium]|nr:50S ribosomal protein L2 [Candidatus Berkelbacteria bacterium]